MTPKELLRVIASHVFNASQQIDLAKTPQAIEPICQDTAQDILNICAENQACLAVWRLRTAAARKGKHQSGHHRTFGEEHK